jgi:catechol 2,3-dioxygenase-like lactoylglutathione lyase family enzyme
MFERFTEQARRALFFARFEASQQGGTSIDTEHLLLGVLRESKGPISRILERYHVSGERIRNDVEGRSLFREKVPTYVDIPFTSETVRALHFAVEEADRLRHRDIGTEHLLLGLLREEASIAAKMLATYGLHLDGVRSEVVNLLNEAATGRTTPDRSHADRFRVLQLDHVELFVPNRYEAASWYQRVLGLEIVPEYREWADDPHGPLMISSDDGSTKLALFEGQPQDSRPTAGFHLVAFRVDAEGFLAFLRQLGEAKLRDDRDRLLTAGAVRDHQKAYSVYFCDPYGHRLEVTTYDYERTREALPAFTDLT